MKLLSVLAWSSLLLLALVPATPTAAAWQPCVKDECVVVQRGDDWACAGVNVDWEVYGACAEASPTCVATRSGRLYEEYCAPSERLAPVLSMGIGGGCVAVAPENGGPAVCADRKSGCVTAQSAYIKEEACASGLVAPLLP